MGIIFVGVGMCLVIGVFLGNLIVLAINTSIEINEGAVKGEEE